MVICGHSCKYKVLCSFPQRKLVFFDYCFAYFVVYERTSIISNTSIKFRHIRWRKRHSQIKESLQIPAGIETASIVLPNRMLQFLRIYRKNECESVIRKIVLDSLQKFYSETWSAAIKFIHKNDKAISPFIEKRIKKVFYLFLNAFCFFYFRKRIFASECINYRCPIFSCKRIQNSRCYFYSVAVFGKGVVQLNIIDDFVYKR